MIPSSFDYEVASSVEEAVALLEAGGGDAKLLAGGMSLLPLMKLRFARPSLLVDIGRVKDLSYVREEKDHVAIGALTRHHDLQYSGVLSQHCPILCSAAGLVGDPQVRHRGTIGGAVAHGDPASDLAAVLLALDAELVVRGRDGERVIAAADFFKGLFETALRPAEVLTEIRVAKLDPKRNAWAYLKFNRRAQDWAIVGVAVVLERGNGKIDRAAVGLCNMGATPLRARAVEAALARTKADAVAQAAERAPEGTQPPTDTNASAEFRRHLAKVLTRRAVLEALGR